VDNFDALPRPHRRLMLSSIRRGQRVTDAERHGVVIDVHVQSRRGLEGAVISDVQVRFDDGVAEWVDPDNLFDEAQDGGALKA
jgi:hypothetical protein